MKDSITCNVCGKVFEAAHRTVPIRKFCSRACWAAAWSIKQREDNVARRPGMGARISAGIHARGTRTREQNPNWKGGQWLELGYVTINVGPNKHRRRSHIVWDETHPDDPVLPGQVVHHMNHVKTDDRPENLMKLAGQRDHVRQHVADQGTFPGAKKLGRPKGS